MISTVTTEPLREGSLRKADLNSRWSVSQLWGSPRVSANVFPSQGHFTPVDVKTNLTEPYCTHITPPPPPRMGWQEEMGLGGEPPEAHVGARRLLRTGGITALSHGLMGEKGRWRQVIHLKTHCLPRCGAPHQGAGAGCTPCESHGQRRGQDPLRAAHPLTLVGPGQEW